MSNPLLQSLQMTFMGAGYAQVATLAGPRPTQQALVVAHNPDPLHIKINHEALQTDLRVKIGGDADYEASPAMLKMAGEEDTAETQTQYLAATRALYGPGALGHINSDWYCKRPIISITINSERPQEHLKRAIQFSLREGSLHGCHRIEWSLLDDTIGLSETAAAEVLISAIRNHWDSNPSETPNIHILPLYNEPLLFSSIEKMLGHREV